WGWMIDPPVPGFAYARDVEPTQLPGTWIVLSRDSAYNSTGHPIAVGKDAVGRYVVWLPEISVGGVATVTTRTDTDAQCRVTGQVSSPPPFFGTDLAI